MSELPRDAHLTDAQVENLIDNSDGRWHDGEFRIDARDLTRLLQKAALAAAPLQAAEPVAYLVDWEDIGEGTSMSLFYGENAKQHMEDSVVLARRARNQDATVTPLYLHPLPESAASQGKAEADARDAARYRWLKSNGSRIGILLMHTDVYDVREVGDFLPHDECDAVIDATMIGATS